MKIKGGLLFDGINNSKYIEKKKFFLLVNLTINIIE